MLGLNDEEELSKGSDLGKVDGGPRTLVGAIICIAIPLEISARLLEGLSLYND